MLLMIASLLVFGIGSRAMIPRGANLKRITRIAVPEMVETTSFPENPSSNIRSIIAKAANIVPLGAALIGARSAEANSGAVGFETATNAFTNLGDLKMCRLLNGMWQVSGAHGYLPEREKAVEEMSHCADEGFTTFDLADIYGPAEDYVGAFSSSTSSAPLAKQCQFFTKLVPPPRDTPRSETTANIDRSLRRMRTDRLDLLQFHWWDYDNKAYYNVMEHLVDLKGEGKIRNIGLTNFDTEHMADLKSRGVPIVSNQVAFSIIDTRPLRKMAAYSTENNIKLLCYGTLLGGFLSSSWLNKPEPSSETLSNVSLRKYLPWIRYWGGWGLFQELLAVLDTIAKKHNVSISNVAVRWVLDQPAVGGAIVGIRLGLREHLEDNKRVFSFKLDDEDIAVIGAVQAKSRDLITAFGDCGGEYRRRG